MDPRLFLETIADGPPGSPYAVAKGKGMIAGKFAPGFTLRLAYKDVGLALEAAREHQLELPVTEALVPRWHQAIADGHADEDLSAVIAVASLEPSRWLCSTAPSPTWSAPPPWRARGDHLGRPAAGR